MSEMIKCGPRDLIKYPFLTGSKEYLAGFTVEKVGNDQELKPIFDKAYERIKCALYGIKYIQDDSATKEILSFFISLVILRITNVSFFCKRFALEEAKRSEKYMEVDLVESPELINRILFEMFGIEIKHDGSNYMIKIADYLKHSVNFNDLPWKLINRRVEDGYVYLTRHESIRLLRHELQYKIYEKIMASPRVRMEPMFQTYVAKLIEKAEEFNVLPPNTDTDVPPCVRDALDIMERGENLSHGGRFLIASFYMSRGANVEDVVPFFRKAPDFNERTTTYQLTKIRDGKYKCPGCDKLNTQDLCRRTNDCGTIKNPLSFRIWKKS